MFSISYYGVISRQSSVLVIGGKCDGSYSSLIAKYTIDKWERVGNLQDSRFLLRAIANDDRIYVVGGDGSLYVINRLYFHIEDSLNVRENLFYLFSNTEIWSLDEKDDVVNMKIADPTLNRYRLYPELFIVDSDFCTKK